MLAVSFPTQATRHPHPPPPLPTSFHPPPLASTARTPASHDTAPQDSATAATQRWQAGQRMHHPTSSGRGAPSRPSGSCRAPLRLSRRSGCRVRALTPTTEQTGRLDAILVQAQIDEKQAQIKVVEAMRKRTNLSADDNSSRPRASTPRFRLRARRSGSRSSSTSSRRRRRQFVDCVCVCVAEGCRPPYTTDGHGDAVGCSGAQQGGASVQALQCHRDKDIEAVTNYLRDVQDKSPRVSENQGGGQLRTAAVPCLRCVCVCAGRGQDSVPKKMAAQHAVKSDDGVGAGIFMTDNESIAGISSYDNDEFRRSNSSSTTQCLPRLRCE